MSNASPSKPADGTTGDAKPLPAFEAAILPLPGYARRFLRRVMSGESYADAARSARLASHRAVLNMLGRDDVRHVILTFAPLLPDREHARRLLEPFALAAVAENLQARKDRRSPGARTTAAKEILSPIPLARPRSRTVPGGADARGAAPTSSGAHARAVAEREARRAAARERERVTSPERSRQLLASLDEPSNSGGAPADPDTEITEP